MANDLSQFHGLNGFDYVPQPFYAYVDIKIGGILVTGVDVEPPGIAPGSSMNFTLVEFEHVQEGGGLSHSFTIKLFDKYWLNVETLLYLYGANIEFQKYYVNPQGQKVNASPWYSGVVSTWEPQLLPSGKLLTIECIGFISAGRTEDQQSFGGQQLINQLQKQYPKSSAEQLTQNTKITDIIKIIAHGDLDTPEVAKQKRKPWNVEDVADCETLPDLTGMTDTGDWEKVFNKYYRSDLQFINFLAQYAKPKEEGSPYRVWMTDYDTNPMLHFRPFTKEDITDTKRQFTYMYGLADQEVIEFTPKLNIDMFTSTPGIQTSATSQDAINNQYHNVTVNATNRPAGSSVEPEKTITQSAINLIGESIATTGHMIKQAYSDLQTAKLASQSLWDIYAAMAMEASLSVVGFGENPLQPYDSVDIIVLVLVDPLNNNVPNDRLIDPTSGIYRIERITDSISGGSWVINFDLIRTGPLSFDDLNGGRFELMPTGSDTKVTVLNIRPGNAPVSAGQGAPVPTNADGKLPPPVPCGQVTSEYGGIRQPGTKHEHTHAGWDIATDTSVDENGNFVGTPLTAPFDGTLTIDTSHDTSGYGWTATVTDENGLSYFYGHLSELPANVTPGKGVPINAGDYIGSSGGVRGAPGAGNSLGPHVHFEVRPPGATKGVDPDLYVNRPQKC